MADRNQNLSVSLQAWQSWYFGDWDVLDQQITTRQTSWCPYYQALNVTLVQVTHVMK